MASNKRTTPGAPPRVPDTGTPRFRSGSVARMLRMPVATLRIWERRYGVVAPTRTPSGHRLYSALDVKRLALLRQLTELGHAIGAIAGLDADRLREVAATHAGTLARAPQAPDRPATRRVVVVGPALARRLRRPSLARSLGSPLVLLHVAEDLAAAADRAAVRAPVRVDLLVVESPGLHEEDLAALQAAARAWQVAQVAVVYGFATRRAIDAYADAGVALWHDTTDERALAASLHSLGRAPSPAPPRRAGTGGAAAGLSVPGGTIGEVAPRRYDDATLADFAGLSTTIACECPSHVAELLLQLSRFEAYSAQCESRGAEDAALHAYLVRVAGASRALFEDALERIAIADGLMLPA